MSIAPRAWAQGLWFLVRSPDLCGHMNKQKFHPRAIQLPETQDVSMGPAAVTVAAVVLPVRGAGAEATAAP